LGYPLQYGLTYEEWARKKATRIYSVLMEFLERGTALNMVYLLSRVYLERLGNRYPSPWLPSNPYDPERFTDFKPSPHMLNFLKHLINSLVEEGFLEEVLVIVLGEREVNGEIEIYVKDSWHEYYVKKLPNLDWLTEFCIWKDPIPQFIEVEVNIKIA
jgi:hypothetical protein